MTKGTFTGESEDEEGRLSISLLKYDSQLGEDICMACYEVRANDYSIK